jgi:hypothetical protein
MKELAFGPRQTGRTTTLLLTMIEEMSMHVCRVYLVVSRFCDGQMLKDAIRKLNGDPSRVQIVTLESLHVLQGVDSRDVYIEHTAYEASTSRQLKALYFLEDLKDGITFGGLHESSDCWL